VVLQPQFRGSEGFGGAFTDAGYHQWGLKMQHDLSDGVKWMTAQGIADADRVCIVGASYGGYATLAGVTLTPELYRCGIAISGVSDLLEMQAWEEANGGRSGGAARYWRRNIGDPAADRERIVATSPKFHVKNIRAPLLMVHGVIDDIVPVEQSRIMAEAMQAAGKPYELVEVPGADHNFFTVEHSSDLLRNIERFLLQHNPPN
jgi:dipeptidyl aminopeptidase/acylaminoacyl peptidase